MNLGIGLSLTNFLRVPTVPLEDLDAAIAALFGSGEVGAWYDPSDSTTVFQDAAGTTAATVGDPVGLILDKSQGGVDATNQMPATSASDWTVFGSNTATDDADGSVLITYVDTPDAAVLILNNHYASIKNASLSHVVSFEAKANSTPVSVVFNGSTNGGSINVSTAAYQHFSFAVKWNGASANMSLQINMNAGESINIKNVRVYELPGNHATQTTSAARPVLQQSGGLYYLDFDGVDDSLSTTFAAAQAQPNSIGVGFKFDDYTTKVFDFVYDGVSSSARHVLVDNAGTMQVVAGTTMSCGASTTNDEVNLVHFNTTSSSVRRNGSEVATGNVFVQSWGGILLAKYWGNPFMNMNGRIYSFVGVNRTLTAGEIDDLETYLAAKSGVTLP